MAELIKCATAHDGYRPLLDLLLSKGKKQESRNGNTVEIEDLIIEVENGAYAELGGARPGFNSAIGAVEGLQLIAGISDSSLTCEIQPNFRAFMDDGAFWGAYGPRTVDQFPVIVERLRKDHDTRQAVVTLWDPKHDAIGGKRDHPCTTAFNFRIRDERLNMTTFMRSNDAYWGWPYDVYQFSMVQQAVANCLGLETGTYTHHAASFHLYEPHWDVAKQIVDGPERESNLGRVYSFGRREVPTPWESVRDEARDVWHAVRGVASSDVLRTDVQKLYADKLMSRKLVVAQKNYEKVHSLVRS